MSGNLQLILISAKLTHDTELLGKMDPYCVLRLNSTVLKTKTHKDAGKFPSWNESFQVRTDQLSDVLAFEVWDADVIGKDDQVGIGFISVGYLLSNLEKKEEWFPITYKDKKAGEVLIAHQFFPDARPELVEMPQPMPQNLYPNPYFVNPGQPIYQPPPQQYIPQPPIQENQQPPVVIEQEPIVVEEKKPIIVVEEKPVVVLEEQKHHEEEFKSNVLVFERKDTMEGLQFMNKLYLKTTIQHPLHKIEKIVIKGASKDQGDCFQKVSSSWVEAVVLNSQEEDESERKTLFQNLNLGDAKHWTAAIDDPEFIKDLKKPGNQLAIYARSIGSGWICEIKECRIEIHVEGDIKSNVASHDQHKGEHHRPHSKEMTFKKKEHLEGRDNMNHEYLRTDIRDKMVEVEEIEVRGKTKDQGFASVAGSSSWIEAVVVKDGEEKTSRKRVFENYCLKDYKKWNHVIKDPEFLNALRHHHGAQVVVYARSQYQGWKCYVNKIKVIVKGYVE